MRRRIWSIAVGTRWLRDDGLRKQAAETKMSHDKAKAALDALPAQG